MPLIQTTELKKLISELDKQLEGIQKHSKSSGDRYKKMKALVDDGKAKAEALKRQLKEVTKVVPAEGFHKNIHKGALDAIKILDQMDGKYEVVEVDGEFEPVVVNRSLTDALADLDAAKSVKGLKMPSGLSGAIKSFNEALKTCNAEARRTATGGDRNTLHEAVDATLAKIEQHVGRLRTANGRPESRVD